MFPSISTKCEGFLVTSQPSSPRPSPSWKLNKTLWGDRDLQCEGCKQHLQIIHYSNFAEHLTTQTGGNGANFCVTCEKETGIPVAFSQNHLRMPVFPVESCFCKNCVRPSVRAFQNGTVSHERSFCWFFGSLLEKHESVQHCIFNPAFSSICFPWFRLLVPNFGGIVGKDGPSFLVEPQFAGWQCRCNVGKDWSCLNSDVSTCQNRGTRLFDPTHRSTLTISTKRGRHHFLIHKCNAGHERLFNAMLKQHRMDRYCHQPPGYEACIPTPTTMMTMPIMTISIFRWDTRYTRHGHLPKDAIFRPSHSVQPVAMHL